MSDLAQVALDFARDCLGWEDALLLWQTEVWENRHLCTKLNPKNFKYTDLNAVLSAVRHWCDRNDASLELAYHGILPGELEARIVTPVSLEAIVHADPCHALLAACVQAACKLKGAG